MKRISALLLWLALSLAPLCSPVLAAPAYVQAASTNGNPSTAIVTLGAAPTAGDLIIGWVACANSPSGVIATSINTSSWTIATSNQAAYSGFGTIVMVYRYAQSGDTAALPAILSSSQSFIAAEAVEISGVNGTFKNDFEQFDWQHDDTSSTVTTNAYHTQVANDLVVEGAFSNTTPAMTGWSGWTSAINTSNGSTYGSWALVYQSFASASTSISTTFTPGGTSRPTGYIAFVISGNGGGGILIQSSKTNAYDALQVGTLNQVSSSKTNAYDDLQAGTLNQISASKTNAYIVLTTPSPFTPTLTLTGVGP